MLKSIVPPLPVQSCKSSSSAAVGAKAEAKWVSGKAPYLRLRIRENGLFRVTDVVLVPLSVL